MDQGYSVKNNLVAEQLHKHRCVSVCVSVCLSQILSQIFYLTLQTSTEAKQAPGSCTVE